MNRLFRPEYIIKWYILLGQNHFITFDHQEKEQKNISDPLPKPQPYYLVYIMSIFTRKIKPLFQVNFPKPYCIVVLWDLQFFFTYFGDPQLLLHNWLWWRPSAHTQYYSQSSEFTHYKSHFGPKIDVSITVIYTKAAREEEEAWMCVCLVQCNL